VVTIDALDVCAQLTRDLFTVAKLLLEFMRCDVVTCDEAMGFPASRKLEQLPFDVHYHNSIVRQSHNHCGRGGETDAHHHHMIISHQTCLSTSFSCII